MGRVRAVRARGSGSRRAANLEPNAFIVTCAPMGSRSGARGIKQWRFVQLVYRRVRILFVRSWSSNFDEGCKQILTGKDITKCVETPTALSSLAACLVYGHRSKPLGEM